MLFLAQYGPLLLPYIGSKHYIGFLVCFCQTHNLAYWGLFDHHIYWFIYLSQIKVSIYHSTHNIREFYYK